MSSRRARIPLAWVADVVAACSGIVVFVLFLLWARSYQTAASFTPEGPAASFEFISADGRLMFGVFTARRNAYSWRRGAQLGDLLKDPAWFTADLGGWGVSIPHPLLAGVAAIPLAWWHIVHRSRRVYLTRRSQGLCRGCGYDLRATRDRCPECGLPLDATIAPEMSDRADVSLDRQPNARLKIGA